MQDFTIPVCTHPLNAVSPRPAALEKSTYLYERWVRTEQIMCVIPETVWPHRHPWRVSGSPWVPGAWVGCPGGKTGPCSILPGGRGQAPGKAATWSRDTYSPDVLSEAICQLPKRQNELFKHVTTPYATHLYQYSSLTSLVLEGTGTTQISVLCSRASGWGERA